MRIRSIYSIMTMIMMMTIITLPQSQSHTTNSRAIIVSRVCKCHLSSDWGRCRQMAPKGVLHWKPCISSTWRASVSICVLVAAAVAATITSSPSQLALNQPSNANQVGHRRCHRRWGWFLKVHFDKLRSRTRWVGGQWFCFCHCSHMLIIGSMLDNIWNGEGQTFV